MHNANTIDTDENATQWREEVAQWHEEVALWNAEQKWFDSNWHKEEADYLNN